MNEKYKDEIEKLYSDMSSKDKQLLKLKYDYNQIQERLDDFEKNDSEKKAMQEKVYKLKKELETSKNNEKKLREQVEELKDTIPNKVKNGSKLQFKDLNTEEFVMFLQEELETITEHFQENKKILNKVIEK